MPAVLRVAMRKAPRRAVASLPASARSKHDERCARDQLRRAPARAQLERVLAGAFKHECASVCKHRGVKAGRDFRSDFDASLLSHSENHFRGGDSIGIDPVHMSKRPAALVMIDVDQELLFQTIEPRALNAVALQKNCGVVIAIDAFRLNDGRSKRQLLINARHAMAQNYFRSLSHGTENLLTSQARSDGVAVGAVVRGEHKPLAAFDL